MKPHAMWFAGLLLGLSGIVAGAPTAMTQLDLGVLESGRPAIINLWYPQGDCPPATAPLCLAETAVTRKVVVFSHGSMGSAPEYSWLGERLAAAGLVVIGVNHFGESRVYDQASRDSRSTALTWQRPQDIAAVLNRLDSMAVFQRRLDWNTVVAIGHSAGGQTVAMLAGARFDLRQLTQYCNSAAAAADLSCRYGNNRAHAPESFSALFNGDFQNARVKKAILLDPALGSALRVDSLRDIGVPSLVIGAGQNDFIPWPEHGARYGAAWPNAEVRVLTGLEGHFVFLNRCSLQVKVMGVALCQDRPGVDREAVHQQLAQQIIGFVARDDEPAQLAQHPGVQLKTDEVFFHRNPIIQALLYTPRWVFGLLAGLCVLGLMQARTRRISIAWAMVLPVSMLIMSLTGVLQFAEPWWLALACWAAGVALIVAVSLRFGRPDGSYLDAATGKLVIPGSWLPMLVILGIFATRYALGMASGMQLEIMENSGFQLAISGVLGAWSGFFAAHAKRLWRVAQTGA